MKNILLLTLATMIWGMGFVGTRWTLTDYSPIWSNTLRFIFAGALSAMFLIPLSFKRQIKLTLKDCKGLLICSICLFLGLQLQTIGIHYTTLAKSGFLTTLYALFTPLILMFVFKRKINRIFWPCVFMALIGMALLCELEFSNFNLGDFYITLSALFFSLHIVTVDRYADEIESFTFNSYQCIFVGLISFLFAWPYEGLPQMGAALDYSRGLTSPFMGFVVLALFSSIIAFGIQVKVQKEIAPQVVSIIFLMESIFASLFGYFFFKETLSPMAIVGCGLILFSVYLISRMKTEKKSI